MTAHELGRSIRHRRRLACLSQPALAAQMAVSERTLRNWEHGVTVPDALQWLAICETLQPVALQ